MPGPEADITVSTVNGQCQTTDPEKMESQRGGTVVWRIHNKCGHPHEVGIQFTGPDPLTLGPESKKVPAQQMRPLPRKVKGDSDDGSYTYVVTVDENLTADPELEVRGPLREKTSGDDAAQRPKNEEAAK